MSIHLSGHLSSYIESCFCPGIVGQGGKLAAGPGFRRQVGRERLGGGGCLSAVGAGIFPANLVTPGSAFWR